MNNTNNVNPIFNVSRELNEILIRRKNLIILPATTPFEGVGHNSSSIIGSILRNIEPYGFTFSPSVINELKEYSPETLIDWFTQVVEPVMKKITGANHKWSCMYPNFPQQVMDASEAELYINALVHYLTFGEVLPDYEAKPDFILSVTQMQPRLSILAVMKLLFLYSRILYLLMYL